MACEDLRLGLSLELLSKSRNQQRSFGQQRCTPACSMAMAAKCRRGAAFACPRLVAQLPALRMLFKLPPPLEIPPRLRCLCLAAHSRTVRLLAHW